MYTKILVSLFFIFSFSYANAQSRGSAPVRSVPKMTQSKGNNSSIRTTSRTPSRTVSRSPARTVSRTPAQTVSRTPGRSVGNNKPTHTTQDNPSSRGRMNDQLVTRDNKAEEKAIQRKETNKFYYKVITRSVGKETNTSVTPPKETPKEEGISRSTRIRYKENIKEEKPIDKGSRDVVLEPDTETLPENDDHALGSETGNVSVGGGDNPDDNPEDPIDPDNNLPPMPFVEGTPDVIIVYPPLVLVEYPVFVRVCPIPMDRFNEFEVFMHDDLVCVSGKPINVQVFSDIRGGSVSLHFGSELNYMYTASISKELRGDYKTRYLKRLKNKEITACGVQLSPNVLEISSLESVWVGNYTLYEFLEMQKRMNGRTQPSH